MSFVYSSFLPLLIITILILGWFLHLRTKKYDNWINETWYKQYRTPTKIARLLYFCSFALLSLSLLDLRGPEEYITTDIPDQRTLIIIDQSASMLAEDIRPSRYERSIMAARHFARNAVGHRIAVVVFSDTHKRVVPFTSDLDLIDARLDALRGIDIRSGGTELSKTLKESVMYFKTGGRKEAQEVRLMGNILLFTDAEEHVEGVDFEIPDGLSLAVVGVGTRSGAKIPMRDRNNNFRGYKRFQGEEIITMLDEDFINEIVSRSARGRSWILRHASLPTDEILDFFRQGHRDNIAEGSVRIRPVLMEYLVIPAILLMAIAVSISRGKNLVGLKSVVIATFFVGTSIMSTSPLEASSLLDEKIERMQRRELNRSERLKLAEKMARAGKMEEAEVLYRENIDLENDDGATRFNYANVLAGQGDIHSAINVFNQILRDPETSEELKDLVRRSLINAFRQIEQQMQEQQDQDEESEQQDQQDQQEQDGEDQQQTNDSQEQREGESGEQQQDGGDQTDSSRQDEQQEREDEQDTETDGSEDEGEEDGESGQDEQEEIAPQTIEQREEDQRQRRRQTQLPGVVEQILNNDRELQERFMDSTSSTRDHSDRNRKDW